QPPAAFGKEGAHGVGEMVDGRAVRKRQCPVVAVDTCEVVKACQQRRRFAGCRSVMAGADERTGGGGHRFDRPRGRDFLDVDAWGAVLGHGLLRGFVAGGRGRWRTTHVQDAKGQRRRPLRTRPRSPAWTASPGTATRLCAPTRTWNQSAWHSPPRPPACSSKTPASATAPRPSPATTSPCTTPAGSTRTANRAQSSTPART